MIQARSEAVFSPKSINAKKSKVMPPQAASPQDGGSCESGQKNAPDKATPQKLKKLDTPSVLPLAFSGGRI